MSSAPYMLRQRKRQVPLRTLGVVDLCVGVAVVLVGLNLALADTWVGIVVLLFGLGLWAASTRTRGRTNTDSEPVHPRLR